MVGGPFGAGAALLTTLTGKESIILEGPGAGLAMVQVETLVGFAQTLVSTQSSSTVYLRPSLNSDVTENFVAAYSEAGSTENTIVTVCNASVGTLVAKFLTPPGVPNATAFAAGTYTNNVYAQVDAGLGRLQMQIFAYHLDGTRTQIGATTNSAEFTNTSPELITWDFTLQYAVTLLPTDRIQFVLNCSRRAGPDPLNLTVYFEGGTLHNRVSTMQAPTFQPVGNAVVFDVVSQFGAAGNALAISDGVMAPGSAVLSSASAVARFGGFTNALVGRVIEVSAAGPGGLNGAPLLTTVVAVTNTATLVCDGTADTATGMFYAQGFAVVAPPVPAVGNYIPGETVSIVGGTFATQAVAQVQATTARKGTITVVNNGSLGANGAVWIAGTTGVGTLFHALGTVVGGTLDPSSLGVYSGGIYTTNPTDLSNEPISVKTGPKNSDPANGLTGAAVSMQMDIASTQVQTTGSYSVVPTDPISTGAGSSSGATGAQVDGLWGQTGHTIIATNDLTPFTNAIAAAQATYNVGTRTIIHIPARNYGIFSGALPLMTTPVFLAGDGVNQTQIYFGQGYTGVHCFGWGGLFPPPGYGGAQISNAVFSRNVGGAGAANLSIFGNRSCTSVPDVFVFYDRCQNVHFDNVYAESLGSHLRTGVLNVLPLAFVRESIFSSMFSSNMGFSGRPVFDLFSNGGGDQANELVFNDINIVNPYGPGVALRTNSRSANPLSTATRNIRFSGGRVERNPNNTAAVGDMIQIGSTIDTDNVANILFSEWVLVNPQTGASAIALYGASAESIPGKITFDRLKIIGGVSPGAGITVNAGNNLSFNILDMQTRGTNIVVADRTDFLRTNVVRAGSSTSAIVLDASASAVTDKYVGGALVITYPVVFIASIAGTTLSVTGVTSGVLYVGSRVYGTTVNGGQTILAQLTGSAGGIGTYTLSLAQLAPLTSRSMTADMVSSREITAYNGTTKVATVGALQGSSATYPVAPPVGVPYQIVSLVNGPISITANGLEDTYSYSIGLNAASQLTSSVYPIGTPGSGALTMDTPYVWTQAQSFIPAPLLYGQAALLGGTLAVGTYDLGPVIQGGTVQNSYAHVASGTITFTAAIGPPGTYTAITGLTALTSSSTTVDTIGTATAANVIPAGAHLFLQVGTAAAGGSIYFTVKSP